MSIIKRASQPLLIISLLLLAGCAAAIDSQQKESTAENVDYEYLDLIEQELSIEMANDEYLDTDEQGIGFEGEHDEDVATEDEGPREIRVARDLQTNFTSAWAKTDTHFFLPSNGFWHGDLALYRLPFENISQGERVGLPSDGLIEIVGISEHYLFISQRSGDWTSWHFDVYRISLYTLEAILIDSGVYFIAPTFHPSSNSLLFAHRDLDRGLIWLESLCLDVDVRNVIYETYNFFFPDTSGWWQAQNNAVVFFGCTVGGIGDGVPDYFLIDSELRVQQIWSDDINWSYGWPDRWHSPIWELLLELGISTWAYAVIDDWIYYTLWGSHTGVHGNFHRINVDGTQNALLQDDISVSSFLVVNDTLIATVYARQEGDMDSPWHEAVVFSEDGNIVKVLGGGWDGHNSFFTIERLANTDIVILIQNGSVVGLYRTNTGALFSLNAP